MCRDWKAHARNHTHNPHKGEMFHLSSTAAMCETECESGINGEMVTRHANHTAGTAESLLNYTLEWLMKNRLGHTHLPNSVSLSNSHTHTEVPSLHLSKGPNYELPCTIMSTMRGPWPHKSIHNQLQGLPYSHHCPTLHIHTHTMATQEPGVPLCNSITKSQTPVLIPSERKKRMTELTEAKKCKLWGRME